ncbi:MAG: hypothetical protein ABJF23_33755 [Bryobacteraceae bacterium]
MFLLEWIIRSLPPVIWITAWRRSVKRDRMERRLLEWNHKEYAVARLRAE